MKPWIWALVAALVAVPLGLLFMIGSIIGGIFGDSLIGNGFTAWGIGWLAGGASVVGLAREQPWGRYAALAAAALQITGVGVALIDSQFPPMAAFALPGVGFAVAGLMQPPIPESES